MTSMIRLFAAFLLSLACAAHAYSQLEHARPKIDSIAQHARGRIGVAVIDLASGDTLSVRGNERFPMQSVYKFPLALAALDRVDRGAMKLSTPVHVAKKDLLPDTWSPLRDRYPQGDVDLPLDTLLQYTVAQSDNNGCDRLFRLLGGTRRVEKYVRGLGLRDIAIVATEEEMHRAWNVQYRNWCTPRMMARLLERFRKGNVVSHASTEYLWGVMAGTMTGTKRLKGRLPDGTIVAHKTGSSGTNEKGIAAATNDVGIIVLPDGREAAVVVLVSDSDAAEAARDAVIASIARAVWDALVK